MSLYQDDYSNYKIKFLLKVLKTDSNRLERKKKNYKNGKDTTSA